MAARATETLRLDLDGSVARLTFTRPHVLNAGNARWVAELGDAVATLRRSGDVRVVVVTGEGRAFSTGVDLDALAAGEITLAEFGAWEDAMVALEQLPAMVIAGINGHCLGGGLQLALVCDYRLASDAALLGLPAVKECLIPSMSLYRLPRLIGLARAKELILLGEPITATEAERYGLVNRVAPADRFSHTLDETVARFLALPRSSVVASKRLTSRAFDAGFEEFRREMESAFRDCLASEEHSLAMEAIRGRKRTRTPPGGSVPAPDQHRD